MLIIKERGAGERIREGVKKWEF